MAYILFEDVGKEELTMLYVDCPSTYLQPILHELECVFSFGPAART